MVASMGGAEHVRDVGGGTKGLTPTPVTCTGLHVGRGAGMIVDGSTAPTMAEIEGAAHRAVTSFFVAASFATQAAFLLAAASPSTGPLGELLNRQ